MTREGEGLDSSSSARSPRGDLRVWEAAEQRLVRARLPAGRPRGSCAEGLASARVGRVQKPAPALPALRFNLL